LRSVSGEYLIAFWPPGTIFILEVQIKLKNVTTTISNNINCPTKILTVFGVVCAGQYLKLFNVAGASSNENTYMMDGINITDPVTGTFSLNFNFDAIEQLQVLTSAYDPEYGQNLGGAINIVTDSGGNIF
jgi:hypothetical protein